MTDITPVTTAGAAPGGDAPGLPVAGLATLASHLFHDAPLGIAPPAFLTTHADWRSWTARDQGLRDYLAAHPDGIDQTSQP
ncbi:hypothetical protein FBZ87_109112 [Nitrospirillum amazonense]|uniref:Uncharacterized protein n=1 Tax=Nitrospirillum amazonense TaxID=28077 RepID=A0A560JDP3_9PROT|nr:hypothetical protein [Nitrospirillum amazonense]TWB69272.1 hypothetical protein FBZ87_109112 [Nitrospirillum amazonense]